VGSTLRVQGEGSDVVRIHLAGGHAAALGPTRQTQSFVQCAVVAGVARSVTPRNRRATGAPCKHTHVPHFTALSRILPHFHAFYRIFPHFPAFFPHFSTFLHMVSSVLGARRSMPAGAGLEHMPVHHGRDGQDDRDGRTGGTVGTFTERMQTDETLGFRVNGSE
jgi:hypothetical protein